MGKGKKKGKATPAVKQPAKSNNTKSSTNSRVSFSQDPICAVCDASNDTLEWFVQCDECDRHFHFTCVGIVEIREEDPWSCAECQQKELSKGDVNVNSSTTEQEPTSTDPNEVDATPSPRIEDLGDNDGNLRASTGSQFDEVALNDNKTSTRAGSVKIRSALVRSRTNSSKTKSTTSSQRRSDVDLERIQAELDLQAKIDEETLALKLEAVKLKEIRERRFLEEKYKEKSTHGSVKSQGTDVTKRTSYVSSWVEDQQKHVKARSVDDDIRQRIKNRFEPVSRSGQHPGKQPLSRSVDGEVRRFGGGIDQFSIDCSIPIEEYERAQLLMNRNSANVPKSTNRNSNAQQTNVYHGTLQANAAIFIPSSRTDPSHRVDHSTNIGQNIRQNAPPSKSIKIQGDPPINSADIPSGHIQAASQSQSVYPHHQWSGPSFENNRPIGLTVIPTGHIQTASQSQSVYPQQPWSGPVFEKNRPIDSTFITSGHRQFQSISQSDQQIQSGNNPTYSQKLQPMVSVPFSSYQVNHQFNSQGRSLTQNLPLSNLVGSQSYQPTTSIVSTSSGSHGNAQKSRVQPVYQYQPSSRPHIQSYQSMGPPTIQDRQVNVQNQLTYQTQSWADTTYTQSERPIVSTFASSTNTRSGSTIQSQPSQPMITQIGYPPFMANTMPNYVSTTNASCVAPMSGTTSSVVQQPRGPLTANQIAARQAMGKEPLPFFNGNPADWRQFIKRYEYSTRNCGFSDDENLERLAKCLKGNAKEIVKTQLMMPECVPEIIDTLTQKFGRPEIIIKSILAELRSEPSLRADKLEALSNYGYKVRNAYKAIESLGMHYHLYNPELTQELVDKLPHQTKIDWARYSEGLPQTSLIEFSNWLYSLSRSLNRITMPEIKTNNEPSEKKSDRKSEYSRNGYVNVHDIKRSHENQSDSKSKTAKCVVCTKDCKFVGECPKFKELIIDERWKSLKHHKLCRRCLKRHGRTCNVSKDCGVNGCTLKHHSLMHDVKRHCQANPSSQVKSMTLNESITSAVSGHCHTHHFEDQDTFFRIVPVELHYNGRSIKTFAFLDEGSSFTLMERHVADQLNLRGTPETICLLWTNKVHRQEQSESVNLQISGQAVESSVRYPLRSVNVVDDLNLPSQSIQPQLLAQRFPHLEDIPLIEFKDAIPTILIGLKHVRLATPLETVEGREDEPIATRSRLGWSVYGSARNHIVGNVNLHRVNRCPCQDRDDETHAMIKEYFTIENFGVVASSMSLESKENEQALEMLKKFTVRKGNRFETRLLWKNEMSILPDRYPMAIKRLICLENKGQKAINTINESVEDYLKKGYVTKLSPTEAAIKKDRTWYLPVFTATNPKKPEKLRTVFDGAAKVKGVSLNSSLYTGPDLLVSIVDVLRRFRENRIPICGDIREMYHQVVMHEEDRHSQRFLWRNGVKERAPDVYAMNVMTFGATCSPSAAQYVKNLNASEFQQEYPRAAEAIIKNHYVDDMMDGTETVEEAIQLVQDVKFIHAQGGFEIRNFKSSSTELLIAIGEPVNIDDKVSVENESKMERVLGMFWDTKSDCFTFSLKFTKVKSEILFGKKLPTKREALQLVMSVFDPLGLLSYYLVHLKCLLQDVWRSKVKWDDQIPEELRDKWARWIEILPNVTTLNIPRWYSVNLSTKLSKTVEMHIFVDAGEEAFATVAYLRVKTEEGVQCSLIGSKARVSPLKYLSIPRKELMASVLGSRLANSIRDGLSTKIDRRIIWTDSYTVLTWLHSEHRKYSQFVAHRVGEIMESTNLNEWRWVPTKLNVADEATKWSKTPTFNSSDRWFTAPEFLKAPECDWPKMQKKIIPNGTTEEMKMFCSHSKLILPSIVDATRFSKWSRLVRAVAYATRFVNILAALIRKSKSPSGLLTQVELWNAEKVLFRQAQWDGYTEEMITLVRNQKFVQEQRKLIIMKSEISDCLPYLDDSGLLRVKGRIDQAQALTMDAKRPIIMPRNHRITKLLVHSYHVKFLHQNHETVINELKQRFYIPRIRTVLNSVRWNCKACELRRCKPRPPQMADLPAIRFEAGVRPFTYTGIDYFGPFTVMVGKRTEKRWGVLMTCLTIRAIHIEIAPSLSTESCILCLGNFTNIRGKPRHIYSDNGTNFKSADKELRKELEKLDSEELSKSVTSRYTQWHFNPPASPHMAGCWERLIRTFKSCLKVSMTARTPRDEVLRNLFMEAMNVVNSRPLTFVPVGAEDKEALTPNHYIFGTSNGLKPPGIFKSDGPYLRAGWREVQRCTNIFWNRFITEYIPTLTRRAKWFENVKPLEVGDLVLHIDPSSPRNTYTRARITETMVGSNNQVRRAKIQFADGSTLWRPAVKLALLDVMDPDPTPKAGIDVNSPAPASQGGLGPLQKAPKNGSDAPASTFSESLDHPDVTIETGGSNVGAMISDQKLVRRSGRTSGRTTQSIKSTV